MLVTIERIERKKNGEGSTYAVVHTGEGQKLFAWDGKVIGALQAGAVYEVEVRDGRFPKLVKARPVATANGSGETTSPRERPQALDARAQERLQALQVVAALAPWLRLESMDQVLQAADRVLAWLQGGEA